MALMNLSLNLSEGEVFGYIGPNGAGKTTTIKILTGLVRDYSGEVLIEGVSLRENPTISQTRVGYLPQDVGFQEWRTVEQALNTFGTLSGIDRQQLPVAVDRSLDLAGLGEHKKRRIVHLSGGTIQRLRLAKAILHDPKILVLDEPMSGLDPTSRFQVRQIIGNLAGSDKTVFVSSHILSELEGIATRIGILHDGEIREIGTPAELRQRHQVGTIIELELRPGSNVDVGSVVEKPIIRLQNAGPDRVLLHIEPGTSVDDAMPVVMQRLLSEGIPARSVRHLQPSLEDVYLNLTNGDQ